MISWILGRLGSYLWPVVGAAFVAVTLAAGVQTKRVTWAKAETQQVKDVAMLDRAQRTQVALDATEKVRVLENEYRAKLEEANHALSAENDKNTATRLALDRANRALADSDNRLRDALTSYASGSGLTPSVAAASASQRAAALGTILAEAIRLDDEAMQLEAELAEAAESASADVRALMLAWPR